MTTLDALTDRVRQVLGPNSGLGYAVRLELDELGLIHIDGRSIPNVIGNDDEPGDATLRCSPETFAKLLEGELGATMAYMTGRLKVSGSMGVALKLASLLED